MVNATVEENSNYEEPAIQEIVQIIAELRATKAGAIENSAIQKIHAELLGIKKNYMSSFKVYDPPVIVTRHLDGKPVGGLLLFIQNAKQLEINPWDLGGHPWVRSNYDREGIIAVLLKESITWAEQNGFEQILLGFPKDQKTEVKKHYKLYESNGFKFRYETIGYFINLSEQQLQEIPISAEVEMKQLNEVDREQLFSCLYETLKERKTFFFYDHSKEECREYFFNNFCKMDSMLEETSIALLKEQKVIGFSYVLPFGEDFLFLDWLGIHPTYRRQGLGTFLLRYIMNNAQERGIKSMGLSCELDNIAAINMYEKNHWVHSDHDVTYIWSKEH